MNNTFLLLLVRAHRPDCDRKAAKVEWIFFSLSETESLPTDTWPTDSQEVTDTNRGVPPPPTPTPQPTVPLAGLPSAALAKSCRSSSKFRRGGGGITAGGLGSSGPDTGRPHWPGWPEWPVTPRLRPPPPPFDPRKSARR